MTIPEQFTTVPNNRPAPLWEKPGLYWNPAYLRWREERDRTQRDTPVELPEDVPYQFRINPMNLYTGGVKAVEKRQCSECDTWFTPMNPNQRTCSNACSLERRERTAAKRKARAS